MENQDLSVLVEDQIVLYRRLVDSQQERVRVLLSEDLDKLERLDEQDQRALALLKSVNLRLASFLDGKTLPQYVADAKGVLKDRLLHLLCELRTVMRELSLLNQRNENYFLRSNAYARAMLQCLLAEKANYNQQGLLESGASRLEF
jgi:hypothetical protein